LTELKLQLLSGCHPGPLLKERAAESAHGLNIRFGEYARRKFVELFQRPERPGTPLRIEEADDPLHLDRFVWQRTARAFAGGVLYLPPFGDQAEEPAPIPKRRLDRVMREIMQSEMRAMLHLLLPRHGAVCASAPQHANAGRSLGYLNLKHALLLLVVASTAASAQTVQVSAVSQQIVEQRLGAYVTKNNLREPAVRQLFEDAGCSGDQLTEQPVKVLKAPNLICTLAGATPLVIVVGAHFDLVEDGNGVVDNWTGASLLPSLYQGLADVPRRHTFRFVSFGGEEIGLVGSKAYVKQLGQTHESVSAMVNMDSLGLAESEVWVSHADPKLVHLVEVTAAAAKLPVSGMNVDDGASTDSESFREKKIPAITIHSVNAVTMRILHSPRDRIEVVNRDAYYRTYQLVLAYLAVLDRNLD
jgi:hypothetical protein